MEGGFTSRFRAYFDRDVAQRAAQSLGESAKIEFQILDGGVAAETFTFGRAGGRNTIQDGAAGSPDLVFLMPSAAAELILADPADDVGAIGVGIAKLVVSTDTNVRVKIQFKSGFLTLFTRGYLGVVTAGGGAFASFLASRGLSGMSAIKAALKKVKE